MKTAITIEPSATMMINGMAIQKRQAGERVYNLSAGEPMIDTSEIIKQAVIKALAENQTHYPPAAGIGELRQEASQWMNQTCGSDYDLDNTLVTAGGKFGLFLALQSLLQPGDEVLIIAPHWVSCPAMVKLFNGVPIIIETGAASGWKLEIKKLRNYCSARSRILILNNGSNPTGVLYNQEEIKEILAFAAENNLFVISDEVYSGLVFDNNEYVSCAFFPEYKDNVLVIQSCSKNFAMTGWRVGFVFGDKKLIKILTNLTSQSTSGVATVSQWAALIALQNFRAITTSIREEMQKRRDVFLNAFAENFGVELDKPKSGLYCFIPMTAFGTKERDSVAFCCNVLAEANVAMVPGVVFGQEGFVRCSFGEWPDELALALKHLADYFKK